MSAGIFPPPFFPTVIGGSPLPTVATVNQPQQPAYSPPIQSGSSSIVIVVIVIASAVIVSASIYLLLRLMSRGCNRMHDDAAEDAISSTGDAAAAAARRSSLEAVEGLPLFTFGSVTGNLTGADCAVCLSKFETHDQLRLLPLCCHAFHAQCIDAWLAANQSCPLCRSAVYPTEADVLRKILSVANDRGNANSRSFRVEIGSISRRRGDPASAAGDSQRSYSVGSSLEYVVDDGREVPVQSIHRRGASECTDKESVGAPVPEPPGDNLAREVSRGRSWLREYVDRIASFSVSSRTISGRFFSGGSSRRSDIVVPIDDDLEAGRIGEEISELFRWLSGV